jgi:hypothetical protein
MSLMTCNIATERITVSFLILSVTSHDNKSHSSTQLFEHQHVAVSVEQRLTDSGRSERHSLHRFRALLSQRPGLPAQFDFFAQWHVVWGQSPACNVAVGTYILQTIRDALLSCKGKNLTRLFVKNGSNYFQLTNHLLVIKRAIHRSHERRVFSCVV